jgi:hypothetical protein
MKKQTDGWMGAHLGRLLIRSACEKLLAQVVSVQTFRVSARKVVCDIYGLLGIAIRGLEFQIVTKRVLKKIFSEPIELTLH